MVLGDRARRIEILEEVVRRLESVKADSPPFGDLDFDEARVAGYVATALSAARAALSVATGRKDPEEHPR